MESDFITANINQLNLLTGDRNECLKEDYKDKIGKKKSNKVDNKKGDENEEERKTVDDDKNGIEVEKEEDEVDKKDQKKKDDKLDDKNLDKEKRNNYELWLQFESSQELKFIPGDSIGKNILIRNII
jgi:hypothetical protein